MPARAPAHVLGAAAANNNIENTVKAYVDGSIVSSAGLVRLERDRKRDHHDGDGRRGRRGRRRRALSGTGLAMAGSDSSNTIQNNVDAYVSGRSMVTAHGGSVAIDATDTSSITAGGGGLAVAVAWAAASLPALAAAVGFAVATNEIENSVLAYVDNSTVSATGTA